MVTLQLPQARRLAMSVVLGQVAITVVSAIICFAVWGRIAGVSALVGGGVEGVITGVGVASGIAADCDGGGAVAHPAISKVISKARITGSCRSDGSAS